MENILEGLVDTFIKNQTNENFSNVIEALINSEVILVNREMTDEIKRLNPDGSTPLVITDNMNKNYIPIFSSEEQLKNPEVIKLERVNYIFKDLCNDSILKSDFLDGYILNPFTQGLRLPKPVIEIVINYLKETSTEVN